MTLSSWKVRCSVTLAVAALFALVFFGTKVHAEIFQFSTNDPQYQTALSIAIAQETEEAKKDTDIGEKIKSDEIINPEDFGIGDVGTLPTSPFYFLKNARRGVETFFTFDPAGKAEKKIKFAAEKLLETAALIELEGASEEDVARALTNFREELVRIDERIRAAASSAEEERARELRRNLMDAIVKYEKALGKFEKDLPSSAFDQLEDVKDHTSGTFGAAFELGAPEDISEDLVRVLGEQAGSEFKHFKNLEVLKEIEEHIPEDARTSFVQAEENILHTFQNELEGFDASKKALFGDFIDEIGGNDVRHLEIIHEIEVKPLSDDLRETIADAKETALGEIEERLSGFEHDEQKEKFVAHLKKGKLRDLRVVEDLENNVGEAVLGGVLSGVKSAAANSFRTRLASLQTQEDLENEFDEELENFHDVKSLSALDAIKSLIPPDKVDLFSSLRKKVVEEMNKDITRARDDEQKKVILNALAGDHPDELAVLDELEAEVDANLQGVLAGIKAAQVERIQNKIGKIEKMEKLLRFEESYREHEDSFRGAPFIDFGRIFNEKRDIFQSSDRVHEKLENAQRVLDELFGLVDTLPFDIAFESGEGFDSRLEEIERMEFVAEQKINKAHTVLEYGDTGRAYALAEAAEEIAGKAIELARAYKSGERAITYDLPDFLPEDYYDRGGEYEEHDFRIYNDFEFRELCFFIDGFLKERLLCEIPDGTVFDARELLFPFEVPEQFIPSRDIDPRIYDRCSYVPQPPRDFCVGGLVIHDTDDRGCPLFPRCEIGGLCPEMAAVDIFCPDGGEPELVRDDARGCFVYGECRKTFTCNAHFEGYIYDEQSHACFRDSASGCDNPFIYQTRESCEQANGIGIGERCEPPAYWDYRAQECRVPQKFDTSDPFVKCLIGAFGYSRAKEIHITGPGPSSEEDRIIGERCQGKLLGDCRDNQTKSACFEQQRCEWYATSAGSFCAGDDYNACPEGFYFKWEQGGFCINDRTDYNGTCFDRTGTQTITCPKPSGGACLSAPASCVNQEACHNAGWYWYDNDCWSSPQYGGCRSYQTQDACSTNNECEWYGAAGGGSGGYCDWTSDAVCGDQVCDYAAGEDGNVCPQDCPLEESVCGDNFCGNAETEATCPGDCTPHIESECQNIKAADECSSKSYCKWYTPHSTTQYCEAYNWYPGSVDSCPEFAHSRYDVQGNRYCELGDRKACQYDYPAYLSEATYLPENCPIGDPEEFACNYNNYCDGNENRESCPSDCGGGTNWVTHIWTFLNGVTTESQILDRVDREYQDYITEIETQCSQIPKSEFFWPAGAGNDDPANWQIFGIPNCAGKTTAGDCALNVTEFACFAQPGCKWFIGPSGDYCQGDDYSPNVWGCNNNSYCEAGERASSCPNDCGGVASPQCSDGIDNDGDGWIDYPNDSGCVDGNDNSEEYGATGTCLPEKCYDATYCTDGIDNDNDGFTDGADPACGGSTDNCPAGFHMHEDFGGFCETDTHDPNGICYSYDTTTNTAGAVIACPGYGGGESTCEQWTVQADCTSAAEGCTWDAAGNYCYYDSAGTCEPERCYDSYYCFDGIDNDNDGLIDSADPACSGDVCDFDGVCESNENSASCPNDCGGGSTDQCSGTADSSESACLSASGCAWDSTGLFCYPSGSTDSCNYNGVCESNENSASCPNDCGGGSVSTCDGPADNSEAECLSYANCYWEANASPPYCYYQSGAGTQSCYDYGDQSACTTAGCVWYTTEGGHDGTHCDDAAHGSATTGGGGSCTATDQANCTADSTCAWEPYASYCYPKGGESCESRFNKHDCDRESSTSCTWQNNSCTSSTTTTTDSCSTTPSYCTTESECNSYGYYWCDSTCYGSSSSCPYAVCSTPSECTNEFDCTNNSYYWCSNDNQCYGESTACSTSSSSDDCSSPSNCFDESICTSSGWYWYSSGCWSSPESSSGGGGCGEWPDESGCLSQTGCAWDGTACYAQ